jgi:hypothetical protein
MASGLVVDWFRYLTTPFPRHLKAMGYVRELKQLGSRRDRCRAAWQPHLEQTRSLIIEAADLCGAKERALILGSGLLFDIPVAELSRRFREVVLTDIVHLWAARREAGRYPNVRLERVDVSGVVEEVYTLPRGGQALDVSQSPPASFLGGGFDLVVSANILSQLPVLPNAYATRRMKKLVSRQIGEFSRRVLEAHLDWLAAFPGLVCLIADLERLKRDGPKIVSREGSLWGIDLPEGGREWIWDLAPRPEMDFKYDICHRVAGYAEFPKQAWLDRNRAGT